MTIVLPASGRGLHRAWHARAVTPAPAYRDCAEAAWRWVLEQVRADEGPWVPVSVTEPPADAPAWDRDGVHSGVGGLALALGEVRLSRPWTDEEESLAEAIADRVRASIPAQRDCSYFDGLAGAVDALTALGASGSDLAVARLAQLAAEDGWPQTAAGPPAYPEGARINDVTLGTAGVLLAAVWAHRHGVRGASALAGRAVDVLMAEAEHLPSGLNWRFVPARFRPDGAQMPNYSHGLAGVATALACAGIELDRSDLVDAARLGAEHLVTLGRAVGDGFVIPRTIPHEDRHGDEVTHGWCHGGTGTSLLFLALDLAGVDRVVGEEPITWHRACLEGVRESGLPARLRPGFWDNDGRCCGTAGVAEAFLDSWVRGGDTRDLEFAVHLADVLLERAVPDGPHAWWRFVEPSAPEPLLPPGVGWMQGAAGIAAFLFRLSQVLEGTGAGPGADADAGAAARVGGRADAGAGGGSGAGGARVELAARMHNWWTF